MAVSNGLNPTFQGPVTSIDGFRTTGGYAAWINSTSSSVQSIKAHNHLTTSDTGNEFKGELINTTGTLFGIANVWDYTPTGATATPTSVEAIVNILTLPAGSTLTGGLFAGSQNSAITNGRLNGAAILEFGSAGVVGGTGTRTLVAHTAGLASLLHVTSGKEPVTGELSNIYCENGFGGTADNVIYVADSGSTTNLFNFEEATGLCAGGSVATQSGASTGSLVIKIGASTFKIPYFA
jgi:hypothetical protein